MATRGNIGYMDYDGNVKYIYNHFDSYIDGLGRELIENYNSELKALRLIHDGDCRFPGEPFIESGDAWEDVCPQYANEPNDIRHHEYTYIWHDGEWWVVPGKMSTQWIPVKDAIKRGDV